MVYRFSSDNSNLLSSRSAMMGKSDMFGTTLPPAPVHLPDIAARTTADHDLYDSAVSKGGPQLLAQRPELPHYSFLHQDCFLPPCLPPLLGPMHHPLGFHEHTVSQFLNATQSSRYWEERLAEASSKSPCYSPQTRSPNELSIKSISPSAVVEEEKHTKKSSLFRLLTDETPEDPVKEQPVRDTRARACSFNPSLLNTSTKRRFTVSHREKTDEPLSSAENQPARHSALRDLFAETSKRPRLGTSPSCYGYQRVSRDTSPRDKVRNNSISSSSGSPFALSKQHCNGEDAASRKDWGSFSEGRNVGERGRMLKDERCLPEQVQYDIMQLAIKGVPPLEISRQLQLSHSCVSFALSRFYKEPARNEQDVPTVTAAHIIKDRVHDSCESKELQMSLHPEKHNAPEVDTPNSMYAARRSTLPAVSARAYRFNSGELTSSKKWRSLEAPLDLSNKLERGPVDGELPRSVSALSLVWQGRDFPLRSLGKGRFALCDEQSFLCSVRAEPCTAANATVPINPTATGSVTSESTDLKPSTAEVKEPQTDCLTDVATVPESVCNREQNFHWPPKKRIRQTCSVTYSKKDRLLQASREELSHVGGPPSHTSTSPVR